MSLPARHQRVLDRIEHSLHACEPRLVSMFAIFTMLTEDEAMPRQEELPSRRSPFQVWRNRPAALCAIAAALALTPVVLALAPAVLLLALGRLPAA
jgi:Protein of unknown function (DUF3040)